MGAVAGVLEKSGLLVRLQRREDRPGQGQRARVPAREPRHRARDREQGPRGDGRAAAARARAGSRAGCVPSCRRRAGGAASRRSAMIRSSRPAAVARRRRALQWLANREHSRLELRAQAAARAPATARHGRPMVDALLDQCSSAGPLERSALRRVAPARAQRALRQPAHRARVAQHGVALAADTQAPLRDTELARATTCGASASARRARDAAGARAPGALSRGRGFSARGGAQDRIAPITRSNRSDGAALRRSSRRGARVADARRSVLTSARVARVLDCARHRRAASRRKRRSTAARAISQRRAPRTCLLHSRPAST